jgi:RNA polymerase sigma factor (sigma-70 family)
MASSRSSGELVGQIRTLYRLGAVGTVSDRQLLDHFLDRTDPEVSEAACGELIERHGPMVLSLCERLLGATQDAEDAFQATFLVLVRKARSIRNPDALGSWLFGIATRVAMQARVGASQRRRQIERLVQRCPDRFEPAALDEIHETEPAWPELYEEIDRLPEPFRAPLILHYFEGLSTETIAQRLGCQRGTVLSRLARARQRLKERLERRGVSSSSVLPVGATALHGLRTSIPVPLALAQTTVRAASSLGLAGAAVDRVASGAVATLVLATLKSLLLVQVSRSAAILLAVTLVGLTWGSWLVEPIAGQVAQQPSRPSASEPKTKSASLVEFRGRIVDPSGRPVPKASIYFAGPIELDGAFPTAGPPRAISDADGRFRVSISREELDKVVANPGLGDQKPVLGALSGGLGPAWAPLDPAASDRELTLRLRADDVPISGRVIDLQGRPVQDATVAVLYVAAIPGDRTEDFLRKLRDNQGRMNPALWGEMRDALLLGKDGPLPRTLTGSDGQFSLRGVGRDRLVLLTFEGASIVNSFAMVLTTADPNYEPVLLPADGSGAMKIQPPRFELTVSPGRAIEGTVRDQDTSKPIAGILIRSWSLGQTSTDAQGRYRLSGEPKSGDVLIAESLDAPYLKAVKSIGDTPGLGDVRADFTLKRGVWLEGRVSDKKTGQRIRATVQYYPFSENPALRGVTDYSCLDNNLSDEAEFPTDSDGRFRAVGLPGQGLLGVRITDPGYIKAPALAPELSAKVVNPNQFNTWAPNFHTFAEIRVPADATAFSTSIALEPGRKQTGVVVDDAGRPVAGAATVGLNGNGFARSHLDGSDFSYIHAQPGHAETVLFLAGSRGLGGWLDVKGDEAEPLRVVLQPTGTVTGRLVDEAGKPRTSIPLNLQYERRGDRHGAGWFEFFFTEGSTTDRAGRFRIRGLVPGISYRLQVVKNHANFATRVEGRLGADKWTVKPVETQDWGDVQVKK